jgi:hypothetical protein
VFSDAVSHPPTPLYDTVALSPVRLPVPPFDTVTDFGCGIGPPCVALKLTDGGDTTIAGPDPDVIVHVRFTVRGLLAATPEDIDTVPWYRPAARAGVWAVIVSTAGAVVLLSVAVSQPPGPDDVTLTARPVRLPPPTFDTVTVCEGGLLPPCVAVKTRLFLENAICGCPVGPTGGSSPPHWHSTNTIARSKVDRQNAERDNRLRPFMTVLLRREYPPRHNAATAGVDRAPVRQARYYLNKRLQAGHGQVAASSLAATLII